MDPTDPSILAYAEPTGRKFSVLALTGFGIAFISLALPSIIALMLYRNSGTVNSTRIGVNPAFYGLPFASVVLSILSLRRARKLLPILAITVAMLATASMWLITSRTW
jgi:hypothetical protein